MKSIFFAAIFATLCFTGSVTFAQATRPASPSTPVDRIVDVLDGFAPGQYGLSSVEFKHPKDIIIPWGQGDLGVAAPSSHKDIDGKDVKGRPQIYVYQEGWNADHKAKHDVGAQGGAKVIHDADLASGVNCTSDERPFLTQYIPVSDNDVVCIKNRSGHQFVLAKILKVGINGIRLRVYAGPQDSPYFGAVTDTLPLASNDGTNRNMARNSATK